MDMQSVQTNTAKRSARAARAAREDASFRGVISRARPPFSVLARAGGAMRDDPAWAPMTVDAARGWIAREQRERAAGRVMDDDEQGEQGEKACGQGEGGEAGTGGRRRE